MLLSSVRHNIVLLVAALLMIAMGAVGPIAQPADYHDFADQRMLFGIPNAIDVLSNIGFLLAGAYGLALLGRSAGAADAARPALAVFFGALILTAFGSAWYHLAPDDARLVWDRYPIAVACAALLAAAIADTFRTGRRTAVLWLTALAATGVLSVAWWPFTGDLRPYLLIQLSPLVLIPVLQWQGRAPVRERTAFGLAIALYVLAKLCELGDHIGYELSGVVSGHSLKHLLAALAALVLAHTFARREVRKQIEPG